MVKLSRNKNKFSPAQAVDDVPRALAQGAEGAANRIAEAVESAGARVAKGAGNAGDRASELGSQLGDRISHADIDTSKLNPKRLASNVDVDASKLNPKRLASSVDVDTSKLNPKRFTSTFDVGGSKRKPKLVLPDVRSRVPSKLRRSSDAVLKAQLAKTSRELAHESSDLAEAVDSLNAVIKANRKAGARGRTRLLGGLAIGAALMYHLDPSRGRERRAATGRRLVGAVRGN